MRLCGCRDMICGYAGMRRICGCVARRYTVRGHVGSLRSGLSLSHPMTLGIGYWFLVLSMPIAVGYKVSGIYSSSMMFLSYPMSRGIPYLAHWRGKRL